MEPHQISSEPLWTVEDVAQFLRMSLKWVYREAASGVLPSRKIGRSLRFEPGAIKAWLAKETR